jgi:glyoxylase-like metal-dependent hydrolase (beta-lactamase superfamily II)
MILEYREVGMLMTNCFLLGDEEAGEGVAIDPGDNGAALAEFFTKRGLSLKYILLTHGHFDHVMGAEDLKEALGGRILVHKDDEPILKDTSFGGLFGISGVKKPDPDGFIEEHDVIECGSMKFKVLRTPGHTPGSVSFELLGQEMVFVGDTLFAGSIGRTDFPGGSYEQLISSVREKLFPLGDEVAVYPGHGPRTTIGQERRYNPFF